jgi:hypothetical protein
MAVAATASRTLERARCCLARRQTAQDCRLLGLERRIPNGGGRPRIAHVIRNGRLMQGWTRSRAAHQRSPPEPWPPSLPIAASEICIASMRWRGGTAFASNSLTSTTTLSSLVRPSSIVSTWRSCSNMDARRRGAAILARRTSRILMARRSASGASRLRRECARPGLRAAVRHR